MVAPPPAPRCWWPLGVSPSPLPLDCGGVPPSKDAGALGDDVVRCRLPTRLKRALDSRALGSSPAEASAWRVPSATTGTSSMCAKLCLGVLGFVMVGDTR